MLLLVNLWRFDVIIIIIDMKYVGISSRHSLGKITFTHLN